MKYELFYIPIIDINFIIIHFIKTMYKRKTIFISINEIYLDIKIIKNAEKKQIIMNEYNTISILAFYFVN